MKFKTIFRVDSAARLFRCFRVTWNVGTVGDGDGYSRKITVAFYPRLFKFARESDRWCLTLLGVRLQSVKSYGGIFA